MKLILFLLAFQLAAAATFAQTDSSIRPHPLEEVVYRSKAAKRYVRKINAGKSALSNKITWVLGAKGAATLTPLALTQELTLGHSRNPKRAVVQKIACRVERYDTTTFSLYLVMKKLGGDTATRFYPLNAASWNAGWASYDFDAGDYPVLQSDEAFLLGYAYVVTDRRYPVVAHDFYMEPKVYTYLLPTRDIDKALERKYGPRDLSRQICEYPFLITYSYVN